MVTLRSAIDTLCTLVALLGYALLVPYLALPALLAFPVALGAGIAGALRGRSFLPQNLATLLSVLPFIYYGSQISLRSVTEPVVNILILLLAVRLAAAKEGRHYLQICVLALFALAASSLLSLSPIFLPALVVQVVLVAVALVLLCFHGEAPTLRLSPRHLKQIGAVALALPLASLVLMLGFFIILPRTAHPLWNFLNPDPDTASGFSETVAPGSVADLAGDQTLAFRVQSPELPPEDLYWRGIVLNTLEQGVWRRGVEISRREGRVVGGQPLEQTIFLEAKNDTYLPALDLPVTFTGLRGRDAGDCVYRSASPPRSRVHYRVQSRAGGLIETGKGFDPAIYLQVPETVSPRLGEIARQLGGTEEKARVKIARLEDFFRSQHLTYATDDLPLSGDPLVEFLFEKRRGYCEYFASSFALILRLAGVPTRLVGGYYGGSYNGFGGYYTVAESRAHVWVEALDGEGRWRRLDPTRLADNPVLTPGSFQEHGLQRIFEASLFFWDRAVIGFDLGRQLELFRSTGESLRPFKSGRGMLATLAPGLGGLTLGYGILVLPKWRRRREERLLKRYLRGVERVFGGDAVRPGRGLDEIAERTGDALCREFADIYGGALYRDRSLDPVEREKLTALVRALRRRKKG